tara:strand:+ start:406 stop:963 length:558 start_codon:yes stop_codon:yes gene_type:complete
MTYFKPILFSAAAALAFATPAFADHHKSGDKMMKDAQHKAMKHKMEKPDNWDTLSEAEQKAWKKTHWKSHSMKSDHVTSDKSMEMENTEVRGAVLENKSTGEILQSNETNVSRISGDDKLLMSEGDVKEPAAINMQENPSTAKDNAIVVPTEDNPNLATTVTCPAGTTAQPDMTCHVTGDYEPDS